MKAILRHINLLIGAIFVCCLISCKNSNELVATPGFEPEIEQQQNLEFTFNRDVVPDSLVARWDSAAYIAIDPAVKG
ncbi:MAG: hypothetical protein K9G49_16410, partial [Taibaiella sp.]|nr:hypothetical protein [Taibaiella sp.]